MLRSLFIKNYALIEEVRVDFGHGLTIITGETGAGKSILLDAIGLLIGERATSDLIRRGESKAVAEGEFDISTLPAIKHFLRANEVDCETNDLVIRREINQKGAARGFINDSPATISILKELGSVLLDLHGQHEHQSLLYSDRHIDFLDEYAGLQDDLKVFRKLFEDFNRLKKQYENLVQNKAQLAREREFLEFRFNEIKLVNPRKAEDEEIERELSILENSEELRNTAAELHDLLYESEQSVHLGLIKARSLLERLKKIDAYFEDQFLELVSAIAAIDELAHTLSGYQDGIEFKPERLQELRNRLLGLSRLKKKYGPGLDDVLTEYARLERQLGPEEDLDEKILSIEAELRKLQRITTLKAIELSETRKKAAKKFERKIVGELSELGIEHGRFQIEIGRVEILVSELVPISIEGKNYASTGKGFDSVEFLISTNKGEEPKPLVKVASGGEVSRIMLALKTVLSAADKIPLMIFDEIDTGISGRIAQQVGKAMKALSEKHQIIAITHLGQIAAFADTHFIVEKSFAGEATTSALRKLTKTEHEGEIARLISGSKVTDRSLEAARSLLQEARALTAA